MVGGSIVAACVHRFATAVSARGALGDLLVLNQFEGDLAETVVRARVAHVLDDVLDAVIIELLANGRDAGRRQQDARNGRLDAEVVEAVSNDAAGLVHHFNVKRRLFADVIGLKGDEVCGIVEAENVRDAEGLGK